MTATASTRTSSTSLIIGDESTPTVNDGWSCGCILRCEKVCIRSICGCTAILIAEREMRKVEDEEVRVRSRKRRQEQFRRRNDDISGVSGSDSANANSDDDYDYDDSYLSSHNDNDHNNVNNEEQDESSFEEEIQRIQRQKTHSALLSAHQMEAWKIT